MRHQIFRKVTDLVRIWANWKCSEVARLVQESQIFPREVKKKVIIYSFTFFVSGKASERSTQNREWAARQLKRSELLTVQWKSALKFANKNFPRLFHSHLAFFSAGLNSIGEKSAPSCTEITERRRRRIIRRKISLSEKNNTRTFLREFNCVRGII